MNLHLGIFEIVIVAAGGLLCIGLPIGIIVMLMAGKRKRDE